MYRIVKINYKTKAKVFEDMGEGDLIAFMTEMGHAGSASGGGVYASSITAYNFTKKITVTKSQSEMVNLISKLFELSEVRDVSQLREDERQQ